MGLTIHHRGSLADMSRIEILRTSALRHDARTSFQSKRGEIHATYPLHLASASLNGMELTAADILGPNGRLAARLPKYEQRPQQLEMAEAVARAIAGKRHLVAEAGTGVGKSFAYLVPAILAATEAEEKKLK